MQIKTIYQNSGTHLQTKHTHTTTVCDCTVDFTPSCTNTESSLSKIAQRSNEQTETVALWLWEELLNCPSISREIPLTHILRHQPDTAHCPLLNSRDMTFSSSRKLSMEERNKTKRRNRCEKQLLFPMKSLQTNTTERERAFPVAGKLKTLGNRLGGNRINQISHFGSMPKAMYDRQRIVLLR